MGRGPNTDEQRRTALAVRTRQIVPHAPDIVESDNKSVKEAKALAQGSLEEEAKRNEHSRTERFRDHVAKAILIVFWIVFVALVLAGMLWFWHLIMPESKHFLSSYQTDKIGNWLFGGMLSVFMNNYAKKRLL
jgi:hypothetical protein